MEDIGVELFKPQKCGKIGPRNYRMMRQEAPWESLILLLG
jgi:hypothetical protein